MNDCKCMNITYLNSLFHNHRDSPSLAINSLCFKHSLESEICHNLDNVLFTLKPNVFWPVLHDFVYKFLLLSTVYFDKEKDGEIK